MVNWMYSRILSICLCSILKIVYCSSSLSLTFVYIYIGNPTRFDLLLSDVFDIEMLWFTTTFNVGNSFKFTSLMNVNLLLSNIQFSGATLSNCFVERNVRDYSRHNTFSSAHIHLIANICSDLNCLYLCIILIIITHFQTHTHTESER